MLYFELFWNTKEINQKNIDHQQSQLNKERKHVATGRIIAKFTISLLSLRMTNELSFCQ